MSGTFALAAAPSAVLVVGLLLTGAAAVSRPPLPYDRTNPVIYDNDGAIESGFTDVYVAVLASAGVIDLRGLVSTSSYGEEGRDPPRSPLPEVEVVRERQELVEKARRSGLRNLPDATPGASVSLGRPASGRIEDTRPLGTPGSWLIVREARRATAERPLVVLMGGQATTVVDAYLLDPYIADRMVLAWIVGNRRPDGDVDASEYNAAVDPWATYIAFERPRVVAFPQTNDGDDTNDAAAATPKSRLGELPDTELRQMMMESRWPRRDRYSEPTHDYDAIPAFPLTRPDYVKRLKRLSFSHWESQPRNPARRVPFFKDDPDGRVLAVWQGSAAVATDEWWRRSTDPAAWGQASDRVPMTGRPWPIPGAIEAEHFDHGGTGRAYRDTTNNWTRSSWFNPIRFLEHVDVLASPTASGGYKVGRTVAGEWIEYTVDVPKTGPYVVSVRVASRGPGGTFRLELDGVDRTGSMRVPDTGGWDAWTVVSRRGVRLQAGPQVLRLVMETNGAAGAVGDFDVLRIEASPISGVILR